MIKKVIHHNYFSIALSLIVPLLILGPFFPDLLLSISSLIFLIYIIKYKQYYLLNNLFFKFFFIFYLIVSLPIIFTGDENFVKMKFSIFFYFRIGFFVCLCVYLRSLNDNFNNYFFYSCLVSLFSLIVDSFYQLIYGHNIFGFVAKSTRISSFFGDELILGSYIAKIYPIFAGLLILKKNFKYKKYIFSFFSFFCFALTFYSGERAALYSLILTFVLFFFITKNIYSLQLKILSPIIIIFLLIFSQTDKHRIVRMFVEPAAIINSSSDDKFIFFTKNHDSHLRTAFNIFVDNPIVGYGAKTFREACKITRYQSGLNPCNTHPHNYYIQLLAETGIFSFLFMIFFYLYLLKEYISKFAKVFSSSFNRDISAHKIMFLCGLIAFFSPLQTTGNFFNNWLMVVYSIQLSFFFDYFDTKKTNS